MKYILFLIVLFSLNISAASESLAVEDEAPAYEESYRDTLPYKWHRRGNKVTNEKKTELNDAQIFEQQMLERKRQNYKPRATTKKVSGRAKSTGSQSSTKKSASSSSSSRSNGTPSGASRGLPSLGTGMFVK